MQSFAFQAAPDYDNPGASFSPTGIWRSLVAHFVRDEGVAGSNPVIPTEIGQLL